MEINDRVYGELTITEPVLIELINSKPLQRLKGINQAGATQYVFSYKNVTRYEHSLGVMILLKKLGATMEEQIAGLLHDTPHTAFSHVIDFVFKSENHDFHERFHEKIILNSEIPEILKKYNFNKEFIIDENNFPLLEKDIPDLCADRIDYTLRDMICKYGFRKKVDEYLEHFIVQDGEIIIDDQKIAKNFAEDYIMLDETIWSDPLEVALFEILAKAIKIALNKNILSEEELFQDDSFVYEKLKNSGNNDILKYLSMINPNFRITDDPFKYDFHSKNKLRYINPKTFYKDVVTRVGDIYPKFNPMLKVHRAWIERGYFIKIISY
jgi:hypothetical protein